MTGCNQRTGSDKSDSASPIRWAGEEVGTPPFAFNDPENPGKLIGFEVEIANEIGKRLGRSMEYVPVPWETMIPGLNRGDYDIILSGMEITPDREKEVLFSEPYYISSQQLITRATDTGFNSLDDLKGHPVAALVASTGEAVLKDVAGLDIRSFEDPLRPYDNLENGQVDAVLLDSPIAAYFAKPEKNLRFAGAPFALGKYAIAFRQKDTELRDEVNEAIQSMKVDGTLKEILTRWDLWNNAQKSGTR